MNPLRPQRPQRPQPHRQPCIYDSLHIIQHELPRDTELDSGSSPEAFAVRTYNYELGGFVRANSGQGTIHRSGT